jgi:hypothetical protein
MNPKNHGMVNAILAAIRRRKPQAKASVTQREDVPADLLAQIKADAVMLERRRHSAPSLLTKAFSALKR